MKIFPCQITGNMYNECCHMALAIFTLLIVIAAAAIHLLAWFPSTASQVLYVNCCRGDALVLGESAFMDTDWMRWIWVAMYAYQLIMSLYVMTLGCRFRNTSRRLCSVVNCTSLLVYVMGMVSLVAWTILRDRNEMSTYLIVLTLFAACVYVIIAFSIIVVKIAGHKLALLSHCKWDMILTRVLVFNGMAALATWTMILCVYDVAQTLYNYTPLSASDARFLWLGVVIGLIVLFFLVDALGTSCALEYTVTPFIVTFIAYMSVIVKSTGRDSPDDITRHVTYALIALVLLLMVVVICIAVYKGKRYPPQSWNVHHQMLLKPADDDTTEIDDGKKKDGYNVNHKL